MYDDIIIKEDVILYSSLAVDYVLTDMETLEPEDIVVKWIKLKNPLDRIYTLIKRAFPDYDTSNNLNRHNVSRGLKQMLELYLTYGGLYYALIEEGYVKDDLILHLSEYGVIDEVGEIVGNNFTETEETVRKITNLFITIVEDMILRRLILNSVNIEVSEYNFHMVDWFPIRYDRKEEMLLVVIRE